jgi:hypothetical protein
MSQEKQIDQEVEEVEVELENTETIEEVEDDKDDEVVISLGDEVVTPKQDEDKTPAPDWVKELRKRTKEQEKIIREQQAKLDALSGATQKPLLGKKPALSDDGIDYDEAAYEKALDKWYEDKRSFDDEEAKKRVVAEQEEKAWNEKLQGYQDKRAKLSKIEDFEEAEASALNALSTIQQGIIVDSTEMPAHVMYALGKNPEKLKELAAITNPVRFTAALVRMESKMTVSTRKPSTQPEKVIVGNTAVSGINDKTLDRLREEASTTGDFTKVLAYKKQLRQK